MTRARRALVSLTASLLLGCSGRLVNVSPVPPTGYSELGKAGGDACGMILLSVIPIGVNDRVERAYARALARDDATSLTDTSITERWYFGLIGTVVCTRVTGLALRRIEGPPPSPLESR